MVHTVHSETLASLHVLQNLINFVIRNKKYCTWLHSLEILFMLVNFAQLSLHSKRQTNEVPQIRTIFYCNPPRIQSDYSHHHYGLNEAQACTTMNRRTLTSSAAIPTTMQNPTIIRSRTQQSFAPTSVSTNIPVHNRQ
jgi:hypothetical protein